MEVTFDNTYSILRSKTFDYIVEVKAGEEAKAAGGDAEALLPGSEVNVAAAGEAEALLPGAK